MLRSSVIAIFAQHSTRPKARTILLRSTGREVGDIPRERQMQRREF
jgi:hypothetical protein